MRYQVPQFIEMDDKVIGPFSIKQFFYLVTVPAVCYGLSYIVETPYVILVGIIFFPIGILLAFYKVGGKPFSSAIFGMLNFVKRPQTYVWKRTLRKTDNSSIKQVTKKDTTIKKTDKSKDFKKLAQILDSQQ